MTNLQSFIGNKKNQSFLFYIAACYFFLATPKEGFEWKWSHLFFSYEYGFLKRGLIGQLFRWLHIPTDWTSFAIFSALMLVGVVVTFHRVIRPLESRAFISLAMAFLCFPGLLRNLALDWGRFDQLSIMLMFLIVSVIDNRKAFRALLYLSPVLFLIHEAAVLWVLPSLVMLAFMEDKKTLLVVIPAWLVTAAVVAKWGGLNMDTEVYANLLVEWAKPIPVYPMVVSSLTQTPAQAVADSLSVLSENLFSTHGQITIALFFAFAASLAFVKNWRIIVFAFLCLLAGCLLFVVAVDHFRWMSLLCFIIIFHLLYALRKGCIRKPEFLYGYLSLLGVLGLFFGPFGIFGSFART